MVAHKAVSKQVVSLNWLYVESVRYNDIFSCHDHNADRTPGVRFSSLVVLDLALIHPSKQIVEPIVVECRIEAFLCLQALSINFSCLVFYHLAEILFGHMLQIVREIITRKANSCLLFVLFRGTC